MTDITATYQAFALIFVVNFYFVISLSQNRALTAINILVGGATILVVGSRSEIVYIMSYVLFYVISSRYKLISFVAFAVVGIALSVSQTVLELFPRNRFYDLYETGAEGNRLARDYANTAAMRSIWEHPFVGDYANYEPGFYAHNIFSVWVDFGLAGFVLYGLCILVPAYLLIHDFRIGARSTQNAFAIANILACIVLLLTSKNGAYYAVPFAIGIAAYQHSRNLRSVPMRAAVA
ncbi:MAG TPA: hypothetical protein VK614_04840 [Allosphingosinicella sp.]|nr:hypothetical protein [Allosphingosinicella sp.]